jgi:hypothetical protein
VTVGRPEDPPVAGGLAAGEAGRHPRRDAGRAQQDHLGRRELLAEPRVRPEEDVVHRVVAAPRPRGVEPVLQPRPQLPLHGEDGGPPVGRAGHQPDPQVAHPLRHGLRQLEVARVRGGGRLDGDGAGQQRGRRRVRHAGQGRGRDPVLRDVAAAGEDHPLAGGADERAPELLGLHRVRPAGGDHHVRPRHLRPDDVVALLAGDGRRPGEVDAAVVQADRRPVAADAVAR